MNANDDPERFLFAKEHKDIQFYFSNKTKGPDGFNYYFLDLRN